MAVDTAGEWRRAYARQANSDFALYDLLCQNGDVEECQRMHYLQMALEKAAKAHYWGTTASSLATSRINKSHKVAEKYLPLVYREYWIRKKGKQPIPDHIAKTLRSLCRELDYLAPATRDPWRRSAP